MSRKFHLLTVMGILVLAMIYSPLTAQRRIPTKERPMLIQQRSLQNQNFSRGVFPLFRIHPVNRSFDGTNNNISNRQKASWGAADIALYRELPADYDASDPKNAMNGSRRPSARKISNEIIDEPVTQFNERGLSSFVYVWGQFLDHDLSLTPTDTTEYVPIVLPDDETLFTIEIPFYRSEVRAGTGINSPRQQSNLNTAWIDGSNVYGSDAVRAKWLRTFKNGKMKTSKGNWLPFNTITGEQADPIDPNAPAMANDNNKTVKTFVAGDVRAAEHPGLAGLHTLFVREHNRICDQLVAQGMKNDELIYQLARKEVSGMIEAITYNEFLPAIGISLRNYRGYDDNARPDLANTFATGAYRLGHTMVADDIFTRSNECEEVPPGEFDLIELFWTPQILLDIGMEPFMKGFAAHTQYETDTKINDVLRNFLFTSPNDPVRFGIDLGSLNIQRGRDHGLPAYNVVRRYYTGRAVRKFSEITSNDTLANKLKALYGSVDNIDLWVGMLAEDHLRGKSVGITLHEMLRVQFEKLRDGDYYFYKNDPFLPAAIKTIVGSTRLSEVLKRNTSLTNLQTNVFFTEKCPGDEEGEEEEKITAQSMDAIPVPLGFRIYPNPVKDVLTVDLGNTMESATIKVYTADGVLVRSIDAGAHQGRVQINTQSFKGGLYLVNISSGKTTQSFKFVKLQ